MKWIILIFMLIVLSGCKLSDIIETDSMRRPVKIALWKEDNSLDKIFETKVITINLGFLEQENCYGVTNPYYKNEWIKVSKDPNIKMGNKGRISLWEDGNRVKDGKLIKGAI